MLNGRAAKLRRNFFHATGNDCERLQISNPSHLDCCVDRAIKLFGDRKQLFCSIEAYKLCDHTEPNRVWNDNTHLIVTENFAPNLTVIAEGKTYEAARLEMIAGRVEGSIENISEFNIVFDDEARVELLVDDRLPCFAMGQEAGNFVFAKLKRITGRMKLPLVNAAYLGACEDVAIHSVDYFRFYRQFVNELFHLRLAISRAR